MSELILVGYATRYESTREVAEKIAEMLRQAGQTVDFQPLSQVKSLDAYRAVVMGAPLFMFQWHKDAKAFLKRHRKALGAIPTAVFALGPVKEPHDEEEWKASWEHLNKALSEFPWFRPDEVEMFGGKIDPAKLKFPLKMFAGEVPASDIRDWEAISNWAVGLLGTLFRP